MDKDSTPSAARQASKFSWFDTPSKILAVLAFVLAAAGALLFYTESAQLKDEMHRDLTEIANQKASRLSAWFTERQGDAYLLGHDPFFGASVARWLASGGPFGQESTAIEARLAALIGTYDYGGIILFDRQGNRKLAVGSSIVTGPKNLEQVIRAANSETIGVSDFDILDAPGQKAVLEFFAPVLAVENGALKPVAVVLLRVLPDTFIFPLLEEPLLLKLSTESILVRREREEVVFLTDVRNAKATALNLRFPINRPDLPAAMAARGIEGIVEGVDYAGRRVVAALRAVPGPDWRLVVKIDRDEANARIYSLALKLAAMMLFVFVIAAWVVVLWWRSVATRQALHDAKVALERQALVKHFDYLSRYANDMIVLLDDEFRIVEVNDRAVEAFQWRREELIGAPRSILRAPGHEKDDVDLQRQLGSSDSALFETVNCRKDGSTFPVEVSLRRVEIERKRYYQGIARDITERKQADEALRASQHLIEGILNTIPVRVFWKDKNLVYLGCNTIFARDAGFADPRDVIGKDDYQMGWRDQAELYRADDRQVIESGRSKLLIEEPQTTPEGNSITLLTSKLPLRDSKGEVSGVLGTYLDITERKQIEETRLAALRRIQAQRDAVGALTLSDALIAGDVERFAREITELAVKTAGVERANVWLFNEDETELRCIDLYEATPARHSAGGVLSESQFTNEFEVLKNSSFVDADDPLTDPRTAAGYVEGYLKPLRITSVLDAVVRISGKHLGLLCLEHVEKPHHWEHDEITFACQLADKIALALANRVRREAAERMQRSLRDTVEAIALTVEMRDPFTAGHHKRTAELAAAVAGELGLSAERIEGVRLGATIFDIGKISIPAEILNRPGQLRKHELQLVKTHTQVGYEIVKNIEFPWPVAGMILHHHERLDGSGYPEGLKGEEIPLEARILAVADVAEAMCSHRPHRPALGVDAALAEITAHKGTLYDAAVVEACVKLFREQRFVFPT